MVLLLGACGSGPDEPDVLRPAMNSPSPNITATTPGAAPSGPQCLAPGVEVSIGETNGAMGLRMVGLTLRNCGTDVYRVEGYPVITVLDEERNPLDVAVLHGTEHVHRMEHFAGPPEVLDVPPGGTVGAALVWRNLTTDAATVARGAYLRVAPATGQPAHTLEFPVDPGNTGRLAVSPWTRLR
ncbi:Protein of unknown function [Cryptosporangium aurantiacum]|uniref:DUF4232 domain-containing protein n=1 Tax=Cryptosporangium aurantiacum TaxID=134849 RepID=A0A1M7RN39_9ACTN|nr:Protein of unknown function [Cryptosporangium aurantiacum]